MRKLALYIVLLALHSCTLDPASRPASRTASIRFTALVPAAATVATRSAATEQECAIGTIDVLVFDDDDQVIFRAPGTEITASEGGVSFRATLPVGATRDVMVLANAAAELETLAALPAPATRGEVEALIRTTPGKWQIATHPIPMWDSRPVALTVGAAPVFHLTRMVARLTVDYSPAPAPDPPVFALETIRIYNYNTAGMLVPAAGNLTGEGEEKYVTAPTLPPDPGVASDQYIACDPGERAYLFESATGNPAIVAGGRFDGGGDGTGDDPLTWYRIDPARALLRNHSYNIAIVSVSGPGYDDPEEALRSAPFNIDAQVIEWRDPSIGDIVFDGRYMLGVGRNPFEIAPGGVSGELLRVVADHPSGRSATLWGDGDCTAPVPDDANTGTPWLAMADAPAGLSLTAAPNTGTDLRKAWLRIVSGRLVYVVEVVQPPIPPTIAATPAERMLPASITPRIPYRVVITATRADGSEDPAAAWSVTSPDPAWCRLAEDPATEFAAAAPTLSGIGPQTIYLIAAPNVGSEPRATMLTLNNAPAVKVIQRGKRPDMGVGGDNISAGSGARFFTYVGAFWRAEQTGERIIRIQAGADPSNAGRWAASVVWADHRWGPDDGIILEATDLTELQNRNSAIYTANPGDAENYQLTGDATAVEGTVGTSPGEGQFITFRIGLKTPYVPTDDFPARYAVVQLSFGGSKSQRIFLRQGHGADYLMDPRDPAHTGDLPGFERTATVRFSPYNLTAPTLNAQIPLGQRGVFTDYPTRAGAMFQWAVWSPDRQNIAWDPFSASVSMPLDGTDTGFWPTYAARQEKCPTGYRRPTDGPTGVNVSGNDISASEIRQSLWYEPMPGKLVYNKVNSFWGYYADGWFDRLPLVRMQTADPSGTAVAPGTAAVAYAGHLFYNPFFDSDHYNASLFFPAAGGRSITGTLTAAGREGRYWTSSTESSITLAGAYSWSYILNYEGRAGNANTQRTTAYSVRCVAE